MSNACSIALNAGVGGAVGALGAVAFTTATAGAGFVFGAVHQNVYTSVEPLLIKQFIGADLPNVNIATPEGAMRMQEALQNIDQTKLLAARVLTHIVSTLAGAAAVALLGMTITFEIATTLAIVMLVASVALPLLLTIAAMCCLGCCGDQIAGCVRNLNGAPAPADRPGRQPPLWLAQMHEMRPEAEPDTAEPLASQLLDTGRADQIVRDAFNKAWAQS